ncbi:MAG: ACT domain-containing protein [Clostridia bacterium]|nr:ACT domain-containing protein [Clostridia bacterium]
MKTVISVIGKDSVGITAKVSAVCAKRNANIIDITQSVLKDVFVMVMLTEMSDENNSLKDLTEDFKNLSKESGLDIRVMREEVFNSMHRI